MSLAQGTVAWLPVHACRQQGLEERRAAVTLSWLSLGAVTCMYDNITV